MCIWLHDDMTYDDLLIQPDLCLLGLGNLLLKLQQTIHEPLCCWRTSRYIDVYWYYSITPSHNRVGVVVVTTTIGT